jgi:hypothetical protein
MRRRGLRKGLKVAAFALTLFALFTLAVMGLWNALMPAIFGLKSISYLQALGLLILSKILFGGFGRAGGRAPWRRRMADRWARMTPEEQEKFKAGMLRGCDRWARPTPDEVKGAEAQA